MRKYSKTELRKIDKFDLFDIQYEISEKIKVGAIINIVFSLFSFLLRDIWVRWVFTSMTIAMTVYLVIQTIGFIRIEKIMQEDEGGEK